ncbi:MAG: N-acetylmuramoyl-L-alanine amidase [Candidatus Margulisbacteria bacterium]|nr:N-acetylmuramoyl-L-alanine amidase [Candidatus Margulisiibacteriota bacterium]
MLRKIKLIILFLLFSNGWAYYTQNDASVFFNSKKINLKSSFYINNNRLCIPLKEFSEKVGFSYKKEGSFLLVSDGDYQTVSFLTAHDQVMIGDVKYHMSDKSFPVYQEWYVPLGYYAWYLGYTMNRTGNNYYVSKRLVDVSTTQDTIKLKYASSIDGDELELKKSGDYYSLDLKATVLSFPRKTLSNSFSNQIIIGQITTKPDLAKLSIRSTKPLFLSRTADNEIIISEKKIEKVLPIKEQIMPEDIDTINTDKVSDRAVWIPSFEGVRNIILSVKGKKTTLTGQAIYKDGNYLVPAENVLLHFGFSYNVSDSGNLLIKYGDKPETDTLVKVYIINKTVYVPLQQLAKRLGFGLRWDYRIHTLFVNPIVNDISFKKTTNGDSVFISSFVEIEPRNLFELNKPNRIILDIPNAVLDVSNTSIKVDGSNIQLIKAGQFDEETVRIVIQVNKPMNYGMSISDDGTRVSVLRSGSIDKVWYQTFDKYNLLSILGVDMGKISWEQKENILEIDIPDASYGAKGVYYFNDPFLEKIVGSQYSWDPVASRMSIYFKSPPQLKIEQSGDKIDIRIDNSKGKVVYEKKQVVAPRETPVSLKILSGKKIVVEAGHGGGDVGAIGFGGRYEKWFTLDTSQRIKDILTSYGATVLMPLQKDASMSLSGRTQFANRNDADLFISVHFNAFHSEYIGGISTYYYSATSLPIARHVQREMVSALGLRDIGLRQARFFVLFHTKMPAILIEPCFITNKNEYEMLLKPENRDKIASAVAKGVVAYYKGK